MKILLTHRPGGAYGFISDGWQNAFRAAGHVAERWDGQQSSWDVFAPDLYLGCSGHQQPIPQCRGAVKIAIHVNPHSPVSTGVNETSANIAWVVKQQPDVIFGYATLERSALWSYWQSLHNLIFVPMPTAGDSTIFWPRPKQERDLPLVYIGGYWPYKGRNIDQYLMPLRADRGSNFYGWGKWPGKALVSPSDADVPMILSRARLGPCISEPHTYEHGIDIPERVFKVILSGAVAVHDPAAGIQSLIKSIVVGQTPEEYQVLCRYWRDVKVDVREDLAKRQRADVLASQTYFHRLAGLLDILQFKESCSLLEAAETIATL